MKYVRKEKYTKPYTPAEVLMLALEKEKSSYAFYVQMIKNSKNPALLRVLNELKDSEDAHIRVIESKLQK